jgi:hypothetical protein
MIAQTLKQWLGRLFAWWPGRQRTRTGVPGGTDAARQRSVHGMQASSTFEGLAPQAGLMPRRPTIGEWPDPFVPPTIATPPGSASGTSLPTLQAAAQPESERAGAELSASPPSDSDPREAASTPSSQERHLEFLRYLVKHGLVNEGFDREHTPDQYRIP